MSYIGEIGKENKIANIGERMNSVNDLPYVDYLIKTQIVKEKLEKIEYTIFDKNGNLEEENFCDSENKLISKITYLYDNSYNKIKETSFDSKGKVNQQINYQYDKNGNLINEIDSISNSIICDYSYKLDINGKIKEKTTNMNGRKVIVESFKYDENGNIFNEIIGYNELGEESYFSDEIKNKNGKYIKDSNDSTYEYDDHGNIVKINHYFNGETEFNYNYVFDKTGNWVKQLEERFHIELDYNHGTRFYIGLGNVTIIKREIEYYDSNKKWWNIFST